MAYETPDYLKEYLETASDPFGRSGLGDYLYNKEQRLREQTDRNEEQAYWDSFVNNGGNMPETDFNMPQQEEAGAANVLMGAAFKPMYANMAASPLTWASKKLTGKGMAKGLAKGLGKVGSRFIPGVGWAMAGADLIDYFGYPIYDHIPGGEYLSWRDTTEQEEEE